jgi:hypothetical protein
MAIETDRLESPEVDARAIVVFAFGFVGFVAVALVLLGVYYRRANVSAAPPTPRELPAPRLETHSGEELAKTKEIQAARSAGYAWVDRQRQLVRIPLDRAMQIIATRGAGAYGPVDAPAPGSGSP